MGWGSDIATGDSDPSAALVFRAHQAFCLEDQAASHARVSVHLAHVTNELGLEITPQPSVWSSCSMSAGMNCRSNVESN